MAREREDYPKAFLYMLFDTSLLHHFESFYRLKRAKNRTKRIKMTQKSLAIPLKARNYKAFCVGGEGEIRTLEPCYRLHDFQSCALDQLGDFSKIYLIFYIVCISDLCIISQVFIKIKSFFAFF